MPGTKLDSDAFYELLINAHRDLTSPESERLNARLILLLANEVGDLERLRNLIEDARPKP